VHQSWKQLTNEVRDAAKEVGVGSRSWRRCIKELQRITVDNRWTLVASTLEILEEIDSSRTKVTRTDVLLGTAATMSYKTEYRSALTDSTVTCYRAAVETVRNEIHLLTSDFLLNSASH
jgi:hypothetical protein